MNRDATNLNGTVSKTPDVQKMLSQQADTMNAAQAAGQTVSQGIGLYADGKRKDAIDAAKAAYERGDLVAMQSYIDQAKSWDEGGASRAGLQATGGALIGGLGGGSVLTAIGGAAGAGTSSLLAGQAEKISKSVGDMTGSSLVGNIAANVAATVGGALVGGSAGAAMASNVELYNAGNDPQKTDDRATIAGLQGLLNQAVAAGAKGLSTIANARNAIGNTIGDAVDSAASQFGTLMKRDAQDKISQSPAQLISQGVANGVGAVVGMGGGEPPATSGGTVLVNAAGGQVVGAAAGSKTPDNVLLADGDGNSRPSPRQSELDVQSDLGSGHNPQVSYKNGQEVPYSTPGSVRPDISTVDRTISYEVKNYNIENNSNGLINNVANQAIQRAVNLPEGMQQQVVIDIRGQTASPAQRTAIVQGIVQKSNGIISPLNIQFKTK
ncbi:hypothetical protein [Burkholderia pseudomallei]|uniref:hypothetical protein n=3 Tax=Burkholderia pseudomallei TaxID=28450 RepID=UPI001178AD82